MTDMELGRTRQCLREGCIVCWPLTKPAKQTSKGCSQSGLPLSLSAQPSLLKLQSRSDFVELSILEVSVVTCINTTMRRCVLRAYVAAVRQEGHKVA
jgi:hypothetical protein